MKTRLLAAFCFSLFSCAAFSCDSLAVRGALEKADRALTEAKYQLSLQYCTEAADILGADTARCPLLWADVLLATGKTHYQLGLYSSAKKTLGKARAIAQTHLPAETSFTLQLHDICNWLARAHFDMGEDEAAKLLLDSVVIWADGMPLHHFLADTKENLGYYYGDHSHLEIAKAYFLEGKAIREQDGKMPKVLLHRPYMMLGVVARYKGRMNEAKELFQKSEEILNKHNGNRIQYADLYYAIGGLYEDLNDVAQGLQYYENSVRLCLQIIGEEHFRTQRAKTAVCNALSRQGKHLEAMQSFAAIKSAWPGVDSINRLTIEGMRDHNWGLACVRWAVQLQSDASFQHQTDSLFEIADSLYQSASRAFKILMRNSKANFQSLQIVYMSTANLLLEQKRYEDAIAAYQFAIGEVERESGDRALFLYILLNNLGQAYYSLGRYAEAEQQFNRALDILYYDPNAADPYSTVSDPFTASYILYGRAENALWDYRENGHLEKLTRAQRDFDLYLGLLNYLRSGYREEGSKLGLAEENKISYDRALYTAFLLQRQRPQADFFERVFNYAEQGRASVLLEAFRKSDASPLAGAAPEWIEREMRLRRTAQKAENDLFQYRKEKNISSDRLDELKAAVFAQQQEYNKFLEALKTQFPEYYRLKFSFSTTTPQAVQRELLRDDSTCLLEYFVGSEELYIFLIRRDTCLAWAFPIEPSLQKNIESLRFGLTGYFTTSEQEKTPALYDQTLSALHRAGQSLYQTLIAPLKGWLKANVIIVPEGPLGNIPFEVLLSAAPSDTTNFKTYPYLSKQHRVSYAHSATLLGEMTHRKHQKSSSGKGALVVAPFIQSERPANNLRKTPKFSRLPHSGTEAETVLRAVGKGKVLKDGEATPDKVAVLAGDYQVLHFSTHAKADYQWSGDNSFVALTPGADGKDMLYTRDLYGLSLHADMVVLSACETNLGSLWEGEGVLSLSRAFVYAGAKSIVASLWSVGDASTANLMDSFYQNLFNGDSPTKNTALHRAKQTYLNTTKGAQAKHPYFWAGLVLYGDMGSVK